MAVHLALGAMAFALLRDAGWWLLAGEAALIISMAVAVTLVRDLFVMPEILRTGADLIEEGDFSTRFRPVGEPDIDQLVAVYNRMIDRLRSDRQLMVEGNELLDKIVDVSPGGVVICDHDGCVSLVNPSAESFLGGAEILGRPLAALADRFSSVDTGPVARALVQDLPEPGCSAVVALGDGRRLRCRRAEFRDRGFVRSFYLIEELTEELRLSEKAAYEKLIRLMTHEVMNSVTSVSSLLTSVQAYGDALADYDRVDFERALTVASDRMRNLGTFMNGFADVVRLPAPERRPCDVRELLDDLATLVKPSLEERRIRWEREGEPSLPAISMDKNQMEQVLMNLLKNAAEAIGEDGTITVRTGLVEGCPWLEIDDTGSGIAESAREELFTPFFTTKPDGCGLGLMVVKEVLSRHGFEFALTARPQGGARFRIVFGG